jgi:hypothetical protein
VAAHVETLSISCDSFDWVVGSRSKLHTRKEIRHVRFMVLVKANTKSEAGVLPSKELVAAMGRFNEEMARAGVLLAGEGLHPSSKGARIKFTAGGPTVTDGPFAETKELIAGFWLIQVRSKTEAIDWASRVPFADGEEIEVRQVFETSDFPPEILPPDEAAREEALREELLRKGARDEPGQFTRRNA